MTMGPNGPGDVSLGEADRALALGAIKAALRLASADEDDLIAAFAEAALGLAEHYTGRALIARAMTERLTAGAWWHALAAAPVQAIAGVARVAGETVTSLPVDGYAIDIDAEGVGWVRTTGAPALVEASYTAGCVDGWGSIPAPLRQGVVLLAAHLYAERDAATPPPAAVTALWRPFRAVALDRAVRA